MDTRQYMHEHVIDGGSASRIRFCITRRYVSLVAWSIIHMVYILRDALISSRGVSFSRASSSILKLLTKLRVVTDLFSVSLFHAARAWELLEAGTVVADYIINSSLTVGLIVSSKYVLDSDSRLNCSCCFYCCCCRCYREGEKIYVNSKHETNRRFRWTAVATTDRCVYVPPYQNIYIRSAQLCNQWWTTQLNVGLVFVSCASNCDSRYALWSVNAAAAAPV